MSPSTITRKIKNLLKKYNFSDDIEPKITSKLKKCDLTSNYYETITLKLICDKCKNHNESLVIELKGYRNDDYSIEYTISAIQNYPGNCSIYKGITIKNNIDINYYLNNLLRKLQNK